MAVPDWGEIDQVAPDPESSVWGETDWRAVVPDSIEQEATDPVAPACLESDPVAFGLEAFDRGVTVQVAADLVLVEIVLVAYSCVRAASDLVASDLVASVRVAFVPGETGDWAHW